MTKHCYSIVSLFFCLQFLTAQDSHYWTNQFGPRGSILGNAIMGGVRDNSSIYYNPGYLAFEDTSNIAISASVYQFDRLKSKDGAGKGLDLQSGQPQIIPSMISGVLHFKKGKNHKTGYAVFSKNQTGISTSARVDEVFKVLPAFNHVGEEEFIGQFALQTALNEQWGGACYAYKFNQHISLGLSMFGAYRKQSMEYAYTAKVILPSTSLYGIYIAPLISYSDIQAVEMSTLRGIGKIGLALSYDRVDYGLTITTPGMHIFGSSIIQRDRLISNVNLDHSNFADYAVNAVTNTDYLLAAEAFKVDLNKKAFAANDRQESGTDDIETRYKSPLSLAAGVVFKSKALDNYLQPKRKIFLSFEYFHSIDDYFLIKPEDRRVARPLDENNTLSSVDFMGIKEAPESVFNIAIGYEQNLTKKINLLASLRSNNSYISGPYSEVRLSQTDWDLWHLSLGAIYKRKHSDLSVGLSIGGGSGQMKPYVVMTDPSERNLLQGDLYDTEAVFSSVALSLGYNHYFFKCVEE